MSANRANQSRANLLRVAQAMVPGKEQWSGQDLARLRAEVMQATQIDPASDPDGVFRVTGVTPRPDKPAAARPAASAARPAASAARPAAPRPAAAAQSNDTHPGMDPFKWRQAAAYAIGPLLALTAGGPAMSTSTSGAPRRRSVDLGKAGRGMKSFITGNLLLVVGGVLLCVSVAIGPWFWAADCIFLAWGLKKSYGRLPALVALIPAYVLALNSFFGWVAFAVIVVLVLYQKKEKKEGDTAETSDEEATVV